MGWGLNCGVLYLWRAYLSFLTGWTLNVVYACHYGFIFLICRWFLYFLALLGQAVLEETLQREGV